MSLARRGKHHRRVAAGNGAASPSLDFPLFVFTREAIREVDRRAVADLRIPSILLMEHASLALARHALEMAPEGGILIVCGVGNNAGDGLALARHLHLAGREVRAVLASDETSYAGDAGANLEMARRVGVPLVKAPSAQPESALHDAAGALGEVALVVDALVGTGLTGAPRGPVAALIHAVNSLHAAGVPVLAVDIPSGLDTDTGAPTGAEEDVVVADRTVSFVGMKRGFLSVDAQRFIGDVVVEQIGTPLDLSDQLGERLCFAEHPGDEVEPLDGEESLAGAAARRGPDTPPGADAGGSVRKKRSRRVGG